MDRVQPGRLWSLWDMLEDLYKIVSCREAVFRLFKSTMRSEPPERPLTRNEQEILALEFQPNIELFKRHGFKAASLAASKLIDGLRKATVESVTARVKELDENLRHDLSDNRFVYVIDADLYPFFNLGFGAEISKRFPEATNEIREGHTCLALDRNTAAVFHFMRGVEYGIRALALAVNKPVGKLPFDYEEWNSLLDGIDKAWRDAVDQWGKSAEQINARQFFKRISADVHAFKDDVRNVTAHTRGSYDAPGALSVRNKVKDWFEILATKVHQDMDVGEVLDPVLFRP